MMEIDILLLESLNQFARNAPVTDVLISFITHSNLFKGAVMMGFFWFGWFMSQPDQEQKRKALLSTLFAAVATLITARALALTLPHRLRPMHDSSVDMELPVGMAPQLAGWSSFPSDHAALFGCLASGMFLVSRRMGWLATAYCLLAIMLPRVYSGLHYPSDLLAGFMMGAAYTWIFSRNVVVTGAVQPVYDWCVRRPALFYALLFLISYSIATLFNDLRNLGDLVMIIIDRFFQNDSSIKALN